MILPLQHFEDYTDSNIHRSNMVPSVNTSPAKILRRLKPSDYGCIKDGRQIYTLGFRQLAYFVGSVVPILDDKTSTLLYSFGDRIFTSLKIHCFWKKLHSLVNALIKQIINSLVIYIFIRSSTGTISTRSSRRGASIGGPIQVLSISRCSIKTCTLPLNIGMYLRYLLSGSMGLLLSLTVLLAVSTILLMSTVLP